MGYSKVCYKFNYPVDCQQLPIIETPDGKVKSMLDHFDPQGQGFPDITRLGVFEPVHGHPLKIPEKLTICSI